MLQGYGCYYNIVVPWHHGENKLIAPGAFDSSLAFGTTIRLLRHHNADECLATTRDNLEVYSDRNGLAFRCAIDDDYNGKRITELAASDRHTGVSIGFDFHRARKETRIIGGLTVVCILEACLNEISFVHDYRSAMKEAFAVCQNVGSFSLIDDANSGKILCDGAAIGFTRALRQLMDTHQS
jgi:HK97 family phage prohead protease